MKIQILNKKGDKISFIAEGITPALANALRRIMISEIPTMAIQWVDIRENSSILFDETVAHRMGLIPIKFDPDKFNFAEDCKCGGKGCPLCQVAFSLEKAGSGVVYSGDMVSSNKAVKPTDPNFPIVKLLENHSVKMDAVARLGLGVQHAKHQAAIASYQYYPEMKVNSCSDPRKVVASCPKGVIALKGKTPYIKDPKNCDLCRSCEEVCDGLKVVGVPGKFIFNVESVSGLEPAYIVGRAADILAEKAEKFKKKIAKI